MRWTKLSELSSWKVRRLAQLRSSERVWIVQHVLSACLRRIELTSEDRGTQRPNVSKYVRSVSDGLLYALEDCLVNLELPQKAFYLFGCFKGNFGRHKSITWLFRLIRKSSLPLWVWSKVWGHEVALLSLENYRERFVFIPKVLGDLFKIIIAISWY